MTTPTSGATAGPAGANTASVAPQWQPMVTNFNNAFARLGVMNAADQKKRPAVEKALHSLYAKLNANELNAEVCQLLLRFSQVCESGGHEAKEIVRKLTDAHWDQFKTFKDLKFLSK